MSHKRKDRGIEDPIAALLRDERCFARIAMASVAAYCDVSVPAVYGWEDRSTFPSSLAGLKRWAEGCDAKLEIKITTKAGVEHVF